MTATGNTNRATDGALPARHGIVVERARASRFAGRRGCLGAIVDRFNGMPAAEAVA